MKILVPIDFSDFSRRALVEATAWAEQTEGSLVLLHVIPRANWHVLDEEKLRSDLRTAAATRLRELGRSIIQGSVAMERLVVEGTPHAEIVRHAANESIDQVMIATRGRGALQRFFLGSTSERVVRGVPCPVLMVRSAQTALSTEAEAEAGVARRPACGPRHLKRILVATDFTEPGNHAVEVAVGFARMSGGEVLLTHVVDDSEHASDELISRDSWDRIRDACSVELLDVQGNLCHGVQSRILLEEGVPSARIHALAKHHGVDLIVVGPRGVKGHLLGATAERVVRGASCSVYVAKRRARRDEQPQ